MVTWAECGQDKQSCMFLLNQTLFENQKQRRDKPRTQDSSVHTCTVHPSFYSPLCCMNKNTRCQSFQACDKIQVDVVRTVSPFSCLTSNRSTFPPLWLFCLQFIGVWLWEPDLFGLGLTVWWKKNDPNAHRISSGTPMFRKPVPCFCFLLVSFFVARLSGVCKATGRWKPLNTSNPPVSRSI